MKEEKNLVVLVWLVITDYLPKLLMIEVFKAEEKLTLKEVSLTV